MASLSNLTNFTLPNGTAVSSVPTVELYIQLTVFYLTFAGFSLISCVAMTIGIIRSKKLRSRFYVILCSLLIIRSILSFQYVTSFVYRSMRTVGVFPTILSKGLCYGLNVHYYHAMSVEMVLLLVLLIDRIVAIVFHKMYRQLSLRQAIVTCFAASIATVVIKLSPSFPGVNFNEPVACMIAYSPTTVRFNTYTQNFDVALAALILLLYLALVLYVRFSIKSGHGDSQENQANAMAVKRQMKLMPLLKRLILLHAGITLIAKIVLSLGGFFPTAEIRLTMYGGTLTTVDLFSNALMLILTQKDLRRASFPGTIGERNVAPTSVTNHQPVMAFNTIAKRASIVTRHGSIMTKLDFN